MSIEQVIQKCMHEYDHCDLQQLKREKISSIVVSAQYKSFATGVVCMHVPRTLEKQTNPSKARRMSNALHLEGEAIGYHHSQDRKKKEPKNAHQR
jgi:hypothetical protein